MRFAMLFLLAALLSLTSIGEAQSVTCNQATADAISIRASCTYRTKSGDAVTTRELIWASSLPGIVIISGDGKMRNVTINPLKEGMTFVTVKAIVSGKTYAFQFPPIIVAPISALAARFGSVPPPAAVPVDSVYVYTVHPDTKLPYEFMAELCTTSPGHYCVPSPHPPYLIACAKLIAADKSLLLDSCSPSSPVSTQGILDLKGASKIWVLNSNVRPKLPWT